MKKLPFAGLIAALCASMAPAQIPALDLQSVRPEFLGVYRSLVQIDSTAGHETRVVDYLRRILEGEGIPTQTFALDPDRANLVARLTGNGTRRPLLILAHTDVVLVQPEKWPLDPFGAIMKDGYVWGRGTRDDKDKLATNLMVMLLLKRSGAQLDRDVIFLAESGEEADPKGVGINFMVEHHFDAIDAEFAITEGGSARLAGGAVKTVSIGTAEKLPARVRLVATGPAGHGSVPRLDNPLLRLSAAISRLGAWQPPMRLNDTTRTYLEKLATISPPAQAARYRDLLLPARTAAAQRYLREHEPGLDSMLRTSIVPTMLKAGVAANVIPSEAEATLDIRAVPGEDIAKFYAAMAQIIADPAVKIVPLPATRPASPASPLNTEMYRTLETAARRLYPGVTVLPSMSTGASDMAQLRAKGIPSYGIGPSVADEESNYGAHSDVERLAESSLYQFLEFTWSVVSETVVHK